jgi:hypothetical protein
MNKNKKGIVPMKRLILAGAAMLTFTTGMTGIAVAQGVAAPTAQPPGDVPPSPDADPNAGQPTGAVPANPGMVPAPADAPSDPTAPVGSSGNPVEVGGNVTPPPAEAKDYPLCSKAVQDSCINPSEAKRAKKHR